MRAELKITKAQQYVRCHTPFGRPPLTLDVMLHYDKPLTNDKIL